MYKYKVLKCALVVGSVIAFCLPLFSDYVRQRTLERYDLRWRQALDPWTRVQTVILRNSGNQPQENLVLELDPGPNSPRLFRDFEVSPSEQGPFQGFLDTVEVTNAQSPLTGLTPPEKNKILQALDAHSSQRGLDEVDATLDELLSGRLSTATANKSGVQFGGPLTRDWHPSWKQRCAIVKSNVECPKVDAVLADWEDGKAVFRNAAFDGWQKNTGLRFASASDQLSLDNKIFITLSLAANEVKVLRFRYSHSPVQLFPSLRSTTGQQAVQVDNDMDVFSSFLPLFRKLHPYYAFEAVVILGIFAVLFWRRLLPLQILSIETIFNFALESKDYEDWKNALERHRFFILQEFRRLRKAHGNLQEISDEQVLDFVREALTTKWDAAKKQKKKFRSTTALNTSISDALLRLVDDRVI